MLTYPQALDFLYPRTTSIKFGLDTTRALLAELGDPHRHFPAIHVAGTNGKGSVVTLISAALEEAGWRVGVYTSPHLVSFRERIRVQGTPISEDAVAMWASRLEPEIHRLGATFFEATTCMAFADFAARGVDIAVIEVGLGGRLDSTNVIEPLVSGVTKIAWDHMKYLGDTLTAIATEKAGIAKSGVPFVIGETQADLVRVLETVAQDAGARPIVIEPDLRYQGALGLVGPHQRRNAAVAKAVLAALPAPFRPEGRDVGSAFRSARLAGRFDRRGKWVFDVAHNPDGMRALVAAIEETGLPRPVHGLVSILGDKEWPEMLVTLDAAIDRGVLTMAPTAAGRGWDLQWLRDWLHRSDRPPAHASWSLVPDFRAALQQVQEGAGTVLVTGSFHTVGDVMEALGMTPL